jgi:pilus assembly protein Flp/PilA
MVLEPQISGRRGVNRMLFLPREEGQGLVEYALILVLVAIVVIAILLILGPAVGNVFSNIVANV